ncbi:hypothetical protein DM860_001235 [Cuscuta australis]|uniref:BHLH domain-containing protein n=1 Tax=Cuscuta australis TaxID=267555 RepID=A0A328DT96_9ASTE|nr:hypothetical protein DM860_001235 [Cuscuta australis]
MEQCYNPNNNENNGRSSHYTPQWEFPYPQTPDLLGISHLIPNPSVPFSNAYPETSGFLPYSLGGLLGNAISQDSSATDSFHSLPQRGYGFVGPSSISSLFGEKDEELINYGAFHQSVVGSDYGSNVGFELNNAFMEDFGNSRGDKDDAHFALDKQRRVQFKDKFQALRKLIPNPTKNDRASIVGDAIDYINELRREVTKLEGLIEKKKKRQNNGSSMKERFWFKKTSNGTEVDVHVMDDEDKEVTVKIVQRKGSENGSRIDCLLPVSRVLDELQLGLCHVGGGLIGD